jgi:hypothetical protein
VLRRDDCTTSALPPAIAAKLFGGISAFTSNFTAGCFFEYHSASRCPNSFMVAAPVTRTTEWLDAESNGTRFALVVLRRG